MRVSPLDVLTFTSFCAETNISPKTSAGLSVGSLTDKYYSAKWSSSPEWLLQFAVYYANQS